ncbi:MAG: hypothetical protein A4E65_03128 [Syntrophorhabdus sp. PtaU1.Bin153]|nr:MAG: hypothetical protein A4E65_03128 [Syntrophorhabdus sp. PtaU1.Bin153]
MKIKFIVIILLQAILLTCIIAYRQYWVATGEKILLKSAPVDPRDIFRGDYVALRYDISSLDLDAVTTKEVFAPKERIFVTLQKRADGTCGALSVSRAMPAGRRTFIQGRALGETQRSSWEVEVKDDGGTIQTLKPAWFEGYKIGDAVVFCVDEKNGVINFHKNNSSYQQPCPTQKMITGSVEGVVETKKKFLNVEYGIDSFFVEEGRGRVIESSRNLGDLKVEVSLRKDGKGIITGLIMGDTVLR